MKKKEIEHPKLYFDYILKNNEIELSFYSNKINYNGKRIVQKEKIVTDKLPTNDLLKHLNEIEYNKLLIYILRQEKVLESYRRKGFKEHYNIVKEKLIQYYWKKKHLKSRCLDTTRSFKRCKNKRKRY